MDRPALAPYGALLAAAFLGLGCSDEGETAPGTASTSSGAPSAETSTTADSSGAGGDGGAGGDEGPGGTGGLGGGGPSEPPDVTAAIAACYATLHGDVAGRQDALDALRAATEEHPDDGRAHLFLGMCSLAALAEDGNLGALQDVEPALVRAIELMPDDLRIPGWLGTVRVQTALVLGDDDGLALAIEEMIEAADLYPEFNNVSLAIAFAALPLDTPWPEMAVERLAAIEDCGETDEKCRDNEAAPHNVPGSLMLFGDVLARVGRRAEALAYYEQALAAESAATWPLVADAQSFVDDIDARVAAFTDDDPDNDPAFFLSGTRTCRSCHE